MDAKNLVAGAFEAALDFLLANAAVLEPAAIGVAIALAVLAFYGQAKAANRARELGGFFEFEKELDTYWYRMVTDRKHLAFNFAQVVRFCESLCFVINHRLVGRYMRQLYGNHVAEIFLDWSAPGETSDMLASLISDNGELEELIVFFYRNRRHYRRQWKYIETLLARDRRRFAHLRY